MPAKRREGQLGTQARGQNDLLRNALDLSQHLALAAPGQTTTISAKAARRPQCFHGVELCHQQGIERLTLLIEERLPRAGTRFVVDDIDVVRAAFRPIVLRHESDEDMSLALQPFPTDQHTRCQ
ncbi:hypothetical protein [Bradyrhizobium japonicum]|uniref:hypothetical protein n=1 Tax=Bradyrhizobium japonicum TaxID=375 RepID=UPI0020102FC4|nr:hypothetical protein [Bradyrhizobium japonicum]